MVNLSNHQESPVEAQAGEGQNHRKIIALHNK
jgi:hypothetical protein